MLSDDRQMIRVSKARRCPVCDRDHWCLVAPDGSAAICPRVAEGSIKRCGEAGYLHILRDDPDWQTRPRVRTVGLKTGQGQRDFGRLAADYAAAVDLAELHGLARHLGVSIRSLVRLGIGWAADHRVWAFPMCDTARCVLGIRLRSWAGRKWAIRGGREGLFRPVGLDFTKPLLICEGPTDTAALLDLGLEVVGRPSCTGGTTLLSELIGRRKPPGVIIVADGDGPGERGAEGLAAALLPVCRSVRVICPPGDINDARAWTRAGATHEDVQTVIDAAPARSLRVTRRAEG